MEMEKIIVASIVSASSTVCRYVKKNLTLDDLIKFQAHFYYDKKESDCCELSMNYVW